MNAALLAIEHFFLSGLHIKYQDSHLKYCQKKNNNIVFCPNNWDIRFYQCETNTQSQFTEHTSMHLKQAIFSYKFE